MRLLNRTTYNYLIYSIVVLLVAIPAFYFFIVRLFIEEVDENLFKQKQEIQERIRTIKTADELRVWEDLDGEVKIEPSKGNQFKDSLFYFLEYDSTAHEMKRYRTLSTSIAIGDKTYHLLARISLVESEDLIKAIALSQAIVLTILLGGLLVINRQFSKKIWRPFYNTLEKLKQFEVEKTKHFVSELSSIKEFEDLNKTIAQLIQRNYKSYLNQKEFTENASHEMQSPVAVFQSKLELLMQTKDLTVEQAGLIESLMEATSRLLKLNKTLLLLSKIDNEQFIDAEPLNVNALTIRLVDRFNLQAGAKVNRFHVDMKNALDVNFNPELIDVLLSNLVSNAVKHCEGDGEINIVIEGNAWIISNDGSALPFPEDKIFDRFQKGKSGGLGLGLAIVKKICELAHVKIHYTFADNKHVFSLVF
jgi:signal transduction histidine kinase